MAEGLAQMKTVFAASLSKLVEVRRRLEADRAQRRKSGLQQKSVRVLPTWFRLGMDAGTARKISAGY